MIGTRVGPLQLVRLLGEGGMGRVYLAEHAVLKDLRAVKILDPDLTQHPSIVARFVDEARAAAALRHRNLIRVHDIGQLDDGTWFMVLDYLEGTTLARFLDAAGGPVAPHRIVHILVQVAHCLSWVHAHHVVHRDLKPDNIYLTRRDLDAHFPIVLDLGVAQLGAGFASGPSTKAGTIIGTPSYMAPEQLRGEKVTPAADLFALGVIAYELATGGWFPYQRGETREAYGALPPAELYHRQVAGPPVDPRRRAPGIRDALAEVILAALSIDPAWRPPDARAFALELAHAVPTDGIEPDGLAVLRGVAPELLQGDPAVDTVRSLPPAAAAAREAVALPSTLSTAASQSVERARRPHRLVAAGLGAAVAGAAVVAVIAGLGRGAPRGSAPPPAPVVIEPARVPAPAPVPVPVPAPAPAPSPPEPVRPPLEAKIVVPAPVPAPAPPPRRQSQSPAGELVISVRPWAQIWLDGVPVGQTPYSKPVASGRHVVVLRNDDLGKRESITIVVSPGRQATIERRW